jgi:hypothetical protein
LIVSISKSQDEELISSPTNPEDAQLDLGNACHLIFITEADEYLTAFGTEVYKSSAEQRPLMSGMTVPEVPE